MFGGEAGDPEDGGGGDGAVGEVAVALDQEGLAGAGEADLVVLVGWVVEVDDLQDAYVAAAVSFVLLAVADLDGGPGQVVEGGEEGGLVSFGDQDVVAAVFAQVVGVGALGVECVCGDDDIVELAVAGCGVWGVLTGAAGAAAGGGAVGVGVGVVGVGVGGVGGGGLVGFGVVLLGDLVEQRYEPGDLVGLGVDGVLGDDGGLVVDQGGEQVQLVAVGVLGAADGLAV